jgi:AAA domain
MLYVVIGPPAAGKSTWALEQAKPGDVVIDFDRLAVALTGHGGDPHDHPTHVAAVTRAVRTAAIEAALRHTRTCDVYVIHSSPGQQRMDSYRAMGAEVITIDPGRDVVRQRCKSERPQRMFAVIDEWYREHGDGRRSPTVNSRSVTVPGPVASFPPVTSRDW